MAAMYKKKFSEEHGLGQVTPPPFSTLKYHKEMARLEKKSFREHFNTISHLLTTGRNRITAKFFETVASRVVTVFEVANRDVENWLKAVMAPMETQVREHQLQLRRRLESIKRIHKATDTLEGRIEELEEMDTQLLEQLNELDARHRMVLAALNTEIVRMAADFGAEVGMTKKTPAVAGVFYCGARTSNMVRTVPFPKCPDSKRQFPVSRRTRPATTATAIFSCCASVSASTSVWLCRTALCIQAACGTRLRTRSHPLLAQWRPRAASCHRGGRQFQAAPDLNAFQMGQLVHQYKPEMIKPVMP